jgi:hypothetical protein
MATKYITYTEDPCPVNFLENGQVVSSGDVRTQACLKNNAQALMDMLTPVLTGAGAPLAGKVLFLIQMYGDDQAVNPQEPAAFQWQFEAGEERRNWAIYAGSSPTDKAAVAACSCCEVAISSMWEFGVGAPGQWVEAPYLEGTEPPNMKHLVWQTGSPTTVSPAALNGLQLALSSLMHAQGATGA